MIVFSQFAVLNVFLYLILIKLTFLNLDGLSFVIAVCFAPCLLLCFICPPDTASLPAGVYCAVAADGAVASLPVLWCWSSCVPVWGPGVGSAVTWEMHYRVYAIFTEFVLDFWVGHAAPYSHSECDLTFDFDFSGNCEVFDVYGFDLITVACKAL